MAINLLSNFSNLHFQLSLCMIIVHRPRGRKDHLSLIIYNTNCQKFLFLAVVCIFLMKLNKIEVIFKIRGQVNAVYQTSVIDILGHRSIFCHLGLLPHNLLLVSFESLRVNVT